MAWDYDVDDNDSFNDQDDFSASESTDVQYDDLPNHDIVEDEADDLDSLPETSEVYDEPLSRMDDIVIEDGWESSETKDGNELLDDLSKEELLAMRSDLMDSQDNHSNDVISAENSEYDLLDEMGKDELYALRNEVQNASDGSAKEVSPNDYDYLDGLSKEELQQMRSDILASQENSEGNDDSPKVLSLYPKRR